MRPGSANTSSASRLASRAVRTAGNDSASAPAPPGSASSRTSGPDRREQLAQPGARALGLRLEREQRAGVALEEGDVGAEAADRDLERRDPPPRQRRQRLAHQRRLAVAARRDQEHLLAGGEVGDQPIELDDAVGERRARDDLAVDEGVVVRP